jgi:5-hydroxyisourate hydrolase-like protein (transthyretin family)
MLIRICAILLVASCIAMSPAVAQTPSATTVAGHILETSAGLPVAGATVVLRQGTNIIATTTTKPDGSFTFENVAPGDYTLQISADRYVTSLIPALHVEAGQERVELRTALTPATTGLREIAAVSVNSSTALASTATINKNLNPAILQDQNYERAAEALGTLPWVTSVTSNSIGDDDNIQLRGFDPSESVALIDGHPVGPLGACPAANNPIGPVPCPYNSNGSLFDYQLAQFWGMSNISVTLGSGAVGLYGVPTLGGSIDFQTLNPTPTDHATFLQGYGDLDHTMTGFSFTGTAGKIGYAGAYAVEGSSGELQGPTLQTAMLSGADFNKALGGKDAADCGPGGLGSPSALVYGSAVPPSLTAADIDACTIDVGSDYLNKNALAKLTYQVDSKTSVLVSFYGAASNDNGIGNGQNYWMPYSQMYAQAQSNIAAGNGAYNFALQPSGVMTTCGSAANPKPIAVLNDSAAGYTCLTAAQFATDFSGPWDKGTGGFHNDLTQDYHARVTRQIGTGILTVDGYVNSYSEYNEKPASDQYLAAEQDTWFTHGALISDEYVGQKNDFSFGMSFQHQMHFTNQWPADGIPCFGDCYEGFPFGDTNYFINDTYNANAHFSVFTNLTLNDSKVSNTTSFDPRVSLVYRPDASNVFRITGGAASISPDPVLFTGGLYPNPGLSALYSHLSGGIFTDMPTSGVSCDSPVPVVQAPGSNVQPEKADDIEAALAHRFPNQATVEIDAYNTIETNPIISGIAPLASANSAWLSAFNAANPDYFATTLATLNGPGGCGTGYTLNNLGMIVATNSGQAQYRGVNLNTKIPITRQLEIDGNYTVQTAYYVGLSQAVMLNNPGYINHQQFYGIPPQTATIGLGYNNRQGAWTARIDGYFVGNNNSYYRPAFWYANANFSKTVKTVTFNLGISNLFNNDAGLYQYTNIGTVIAQNAFYPPPYSYNSLLSLLPRQIWMTTTIHI